MNISAKFQLHPTYGFCVDFYFFFFFFGGIATNQIQQFG